MSICKKANYYLSNAKVILTFSVALLACVLVMTYAIKNNNILNEFMINLFLLTNKNNHSSSATVLTLSKSDYLSIRGILYQVLVSNLDFDEL